jgi:hypothetical protein
MAKFMLKEDVSWQRWAGTVLIVIGVAFVGLEDKDVKTGKVVKPEAVDSGQRGMERIDKNR